jgi:hypothetical protein
VPAANVPEHVPGGKPVMAVPGQTPPFPVRAVAPVLVRVVAASAANDFAAPITTGRTRFSRAGSSPVGTARERALNWVAMRAKTASLSTLNIVDFIMINFQR